ncbi:bifunctional nuclease domain-containing protein [Corynebacterium sp. Q4381]|uniref:bifunctional nuclease domain-containing protein n=1 Tax=Corynebacterium sp. Marseille-Q4381 TaxID=3121597 RepID=UPI002FE62474
MEQLKLVGVFSVGPENFPCALLEWEEGNRFIPVWLPALQGAMLAARLSDWEPDDPDIYEVLARVAQVGGVEITHYYQGTFHTELSLVDGTKHSLRIADALLVAVQADVPIEADADVLHHSSLRLSARDAKDYFGLDLGSGDLEAEDEATLDPAELEEFMRELGLGDDPGSGD